ncbi:MAG: hypothetical protein HUJ79_02185 [Firmicutes bacterium]|nr:hypothetical protein [Bacillota bacterium]
MFKHAPVKFFAAFLVVALAGLSISDIVNSAFQEKAFIASDKNQVEAFLLNDEGKLTETAYLDRGRAVEVTGKTMKDGQGKALAEVKLGDDKYYIPKKNITDSRDNVVKEEKVFVRTPVTVYKNESGPEIEGFAPKGTELQVTGFDKVGKGGIVNKYKVKTDGQEGYVYGSYMAFTKEDAEKVYNEHGEYDAAKKDKYGMELYAGSAENLDYYPKERPEIKGNDFCEEARTMYLNCYAAVNNEEYIKLIKDSGCNAVVIDIKSGILSYESPVAKEYSRASYDKAHFSQEEFVKAVKAFKDEGIYTIGRITVFKDNYYAKDHPEDCINTPSSDSGWPRVYSRNVREYNVALAAEAIELMDFNEIQFDYVRFPEAAYDMSLNPETDFRNVYEEEKAQAVQNFCFYATDTIHEAGAYVSIDVFGECSGGYVAAYGQYWPAISNVVDAISSMPYTDHFGRTDTWSEPKSVMSVWAAGAAKGQKQIPTPAAARTWITGYNTPFWAPSVNYDTEKLKQQVDALYEAGLDGGFIPWNSASPIDKYREYSDIWSYGKRR